MSDLQVLTVDQMRAAEQALIEAGSSELDLMERAGTRCAQWIWRFAAGGSVTLLCGPGNNGGDGYVIARELERRGLEVCVAAPSPPQTPSAQAAAATYSGKVLGCAENLGGDVFVDAGFGSGLSRWLDASWSGALSGLAERHKSCVAIDVPSGVSCDNGALLTDHLPRFDLTLALGAWKHAHRCYPAAQYMGQSRLVGIGIEAVKGAAQLTARPTINAPALDAHKYRRGLVAVIAGAMPGAALLACEAAQRSGAGYVKLLGKIGNRRAPSGLVVQSGDMLAALHDARMRALLIGPGLGRGEAAEARLTQALSANIPCVLDADALHLLRPCMLDTPHMCLATPHDGELEAMCAHFKIAEKDRAARAAHLAQASGLTILAKGPDTLIAAPGEGVHYGPSASSWLSQAGSGDVLAGIALGRMAGGGQSAGQAAREAVWIHREAARLCGAGFTADDLARQVSGSLGAFCAR